MAVAALGTDTGGSVRIPSAFCGLTGFKPTADRVPSGGAFPLSTSLDSIGPLAASVTCCAILDGILSGEENRRLPIAPPSARLRLAVADTLVLDGADDTVRATFAAAIERLRASGIALDTLDIPEFQELAHINRKGGLVCSEAYAIHRNAMDADLDQYDPRVSSRILRGRDIDAADYIELHARRAQWIAAVEARLQGYDALLLPTVPVIAPTIESLQASDEAYFSANGLILRNPTLINFLDGCALSLPCHAPGEAPVGLMVAGAAHTDARILDVGLAIEHILNTR
jgi:aspartyl-tRNA(Asn)/glutamyl-tRNA(Gln) amidotransferase subunit A